MSRLALLALVALAWVGAPAAGAGAPTPALVVDSVEAGSFAERAGLRPGDRLGPWSRSPQPPESPLPAAGVLVDPRDLRRALIEEAPRGALTLRGRRGTQDQSWTLVAGAALDRVGLRVHPDLPSALESLDRAALAALASGRAARAAELWREAASAAFALRQAGTGAWFLGERARALAASPGAGDPDAAFAEALLPLRASGDRTAEVDLLATWGRSFDERGLLPAARERLELALARLSPESREDAPLLRARTEHGLAETLRHADAYPRALALHRAALARRRERAPESLDAAESLFGLARALSEGGGPGGGVVAEELLRQADGLWSAIDRGSLGHARLIDFLGAMIWDQGRIFEAERLYAEAYRWVLRWNPQGYEAARLLLHWGTSLDRRGDMVGAEQALSESLRIWSGLPPNRANRWNLASVWWTIAYLKATQGDLETAEADARRALEIHEALQPDSAGVADALQVLGYLEVQRGRFPEGRAALRRAIALRQVLSPGQVRLAIQLQLLGGLELAAGEDLAEAERLLRQADAIHEVEDPSSLSRADELASLAEAVYRQGRSSEALEIARRCLELRQHFAPGGLPEAESWHQIGLFERATDPGRAADNLCAAVRIVDRLGERLAGAERARSSFSAAYGAYYFDCLAARLDQGRKAEAFGVLEAGRARALLDLFSARDLHLAELPEELRRERERLEQEYIALSRRLEEAGASGDSSAIEEARRTLLENERQHDELAIRLRAEVPSLASLQAPRPLDLTGVRKVLDPGTVLLSFAVGADRTYLFVVSAAGSRGPALSVLPLGLAGSELRRAVEAFRALASDPASDRRALRERGRELYRRLLFPAETVLGSARRLLVIPDGALHVLPFAALVRPDGRYLVQWKPLHQVVSATVYAELRARRRAANGEARTRSLGGVGDPQASLLRSEAGAGLGIPPVHAAQRAGGFSPLPGARAELSAIGALYAPHARLLLGPEATEARVQTLGPEVDLLHFATHAALDEGVPLNSALLLSPPPGGPRGADDGRLEVWEIVERVRLDADLVALSACESGLGEELAGEGLIGLTRAFEFAGARSVLASLWAIGDGSAARLMPRFYRHLRKGSPKDEALRLAQMETLADPATAHPSAWAAFVLSGDRR